MVHSCADFSKITGIYEKAKEKLLTRKREKKLYRNTRTTPRVF